MVSGPGARKIASELTPSAKPGIQAVGRAVGVKVGVGVAVKVGVGV